MDDAVAIEVGSSRPSLRNRHHAKLLAGALATSAISLGLALTAGPAAAEEPLPTLAVADVVDDSPELELQSEVELESELVEEPEPEPVYEPEPVEEHEPEVIWEPQPWNIDRGPNWTDRVLLTYDDCMNDPEHFIYVLDRAASLDIGLLLFPTGNCVSMYQNMFGIDLLGAIRDRGHWFGNHTISHPNLTRVGRGEIARQISWPESNILRPPFGGWNRAVYEVASELGIRLMMWDVDTNDWRGYSEQEIVDFVVATAEPGDSVLMHFQHQAFTGEALAAMQQGLRERGIELCRPAPPAERPTPVQIPDNIC